MINMRIHFIHCSDCLIEYTNYLVYPSSATGILILDQINSQLRSPPLRASIRYYRFIMVNIKQYTMQVQYRNCNYIGAFHPQLYQRHGYGLLIQDNSHIIMAKWKSDAVNGPFVIITDRMRALGTMLNNKLEGYNVISIQESLVSNKREKQRTIYGMFRENKLYGKALVIDDDQIIIAHYTNGQLRQISEKKPVRDREVYDMLQICFPNQIYNIADWLVFVFGEAIKQINSQSNYKFEPTYKNFEDDLKFYGYSDLYSKNKSIGFLIHRGEVISIGEHEKDYLQGIGRLYHSDGTVQDGVFKQGELSGIGISYSKINHKYILGEHNQSNDTFEKGFGFPQKQISQIRKQFHLRSIYFYNDIVLSNFSTTFEAICASCLQHNLQNESPRFSSLTNNAYDNRKRGLSQKSPLRAKIIQYQLESDHIDDHSPIKNKPINQYDKTDFRSSKYFDNQVRTEIDEPRFSRNKMDSNQRPKQSSDSRTKYSNRKVRDTKQLVRQLEEKQKTRRGYLDQIYKEAKLYSKKY